MRTPCQKNHNQKTFPPKTPQKITKGKLPTQLNKHPPTKNHNHILNERITKDKRTINEG